MIDRPPWEDNEPEAESTGNISSLFHGGFLAQPVATPSTQPPEYEFQQQLEAYGLIVDSQLIADGAIHRVATKSDKRGKKSGWYVLYLDGVPAGSFGSWRDDVANTWCSVSATDLTTGQIAENKRRMEQAKRLREEQKKNLNDDTAVKAGELWSAAVPATDHAYLKSKGIKPYGAKQTADNLLLVPMFNADSELRSIQQIGPDGSKRFLWGGEKRGTFFPVGMTTTAGHAFIAEGYATAATVHEATGQPVFAAFDAGNLLPAIRSIREQHPSLQLTICADNDQWTQNNPGITKANEAARQVPGVSVIHPVFTDTENRPTDFNDLYMLEGIDRVRDMLGKAQSDVLAPRPASLWADRAVREREWLLKDWFPMRQTSAFYGDGGVGKTLFVQQLASCVATGQNFFGIDTRQGKVLGIFCEDDEDELHRRQTDINNALGISWKQLQNFYPVSRVGYDNLLMTFDGKDDGVLTPFWHQINKQVEELEPTMVIIDTAADTFGGNEIIRPQVRQYVQRALTQIAIKHDCAVVLCAHPSAGGVMSGAGTGGSTAWSNSVRSRAYLERDEETGRIHASMKKANYGPLDKSLELYWQNGAFHEFVDSAELTGMLKPPIQAEAERVFLSQLIKFKEMGVKVSDSKYGHYAPKKVLEMVSSNGKSKFELPHFEKAMRTLWQDGVIKLERDERKGTAYFEVKK